MAQAVTVHKLLLSIDVIKLRAVRESRVCPELFISYAIL